MPGVQLINQLKYQLHSEINNTITLHKITVLEFEDVSLRRQEC